MSLCFWRDKSPSLSSCVWQQTGMVTGGWKNLRARVSDTQSLKRKQTWNGTWLYNSKPSPRNFILPTRPHLLTSPKSATPLQTKYSDVWHYSKHLIRTTTLAVPLPKLPVILSSRFLIEQALAWDNQVGSRMQSVYELCFSGLWQPSTGCLCHCKWKTYWRKLIHVKFSSSSSQLFLFHFMWLKLPHIREFWIQGRASGKN